jgi:hypothetical protein
MSIRCKTLAIIPNDRRDQSAPRFITTHTKRTETMNDSDDYANESDTDQVHEGSNSNSASHAEDGEKPIAKRETRHVWRLKFIVMTVLAASAAAVASTVYFYLTWAQEDQFEKQYEEDSQKIKHAIGASLDKTLGIMDSVAVTWVSSARMMNQTWPFVTLPDFAVRMAKLVPLTDAMNIGILPIVVPEKRQAWEQYAAQNLDWINEGVKLQSEWAGYYGPTIYDWDPIPNVSGDFGPLERNIRYECNRSCHFSCTVSHFLGPPQLMFSRIMSPTWQAFPVIPNVSCSEESSNTLGRERSLT